MSISLSVMLARLGLHQTSLRNLKLCLNSRYLSRFDDELEQIQIIQNIGHRNPTQHIARKRAITLTKEHELMLLQSTGIEIPDLRSQEVIR